MPRAVRSREPSPLGLPGLVVVLALAACGSAGHPDTGYGAGQPAPATPTCAALCERSADCLVTLCDEDTMSTRYEALRSLVAGQCNATCTDALLQSMATGNSWRCLFESSCRQVYEQDLCAAHASYHCS
jgi:hypothetical protein